VETGQSEMSSLEFTFKTLSPSGVLVYSGEVTLDKVLSSTTSWLGRQRVRLVRAPGSSPALTTLAGGVSR